MSGGHLTRYLRTSGTGGVDIVHQLLEDGALGELRTMQAECGEYLTGDHRTMGPELAGAWIAADPLVARTCPSGEQADPAERWWQAQAGTAAAGRCAGGAGEEAALTRGRRRAGCEGSPLDVTDAGGVERWAAALHCSGGLAGGGGPGVAHGAVQQRELSANDAITRATYFTRIGGASAP